ncbi:MAG: hypothetical protein ACI9O6_000693 [Glaciecola sp.]|jgi:hypothetical protein
MPNGKETNNNMLEPEVAFKRNISFNEIAQAWCSLYENAKPNFFLSWEWIGTWLSSLSTPYIVCVAKINNETVGLGILIEKKSRRNVFVSSNQLLLHKTGDQSKDQIWIEYNDFLLHARYENSVRRKFAEQILKQLEWDEFVIGASQDEVLTAFRGLQIKESTIWRSLSFKVDLKALRLSNTSYINTLSKNTRYQINRSVKEYEKIGKLELIVAKNTEEALNWLDEAAEVHIKRWENTTTQSGFNNPYFKSFHQSLISKHLESGSIEIIKIQAGHEIIAFLYNFIQNNEVKFYLCANRFNNKNRKLKPGLVSQCVAIEYYLEQGFSYYDFMGGDSQYKRSLSQETDILTLAYFSKPKTIFALELFLKEIKNRIKLFKKNRSNLAMLSKIVTRFI